MSEEAANLEQGAASEQEPSNLSAEEKIALTLGLEDDLQEGGNKDKKSQSKVKEDAKASKPAPKEEDESDEEESEDPGEEDESDSDGDEKSDEDTDEDVSDDDGDEEPEFTSLAELAEAAGMSESDIKALIKDKIKVQGKEYEVSYDDLLKGQMLESDYRLKTQSLAEERKTFEGEKAKTAEALKTQVDEGVLVLQAMYADYLKADKDTNWERLKDQDPTEYNLRRTEMREGFERLERFKAALAQHNAKLQDQEKVKSQEQFASYVQKQREHLNNLIPSWISESAKKDGINQVRQYLTDTFTGDLAYSKEELDSLTDARIVFLAKQAMEFEKVRSKSDYVKKRVQGTRKITKAKGKRGDDFTKRNSMDKVKKAKQTGSVEDAAAALLAGIK
jgi:hypothetical protein